MLHNVKIAAAVIAFAALTVGQVQAADKGKGKGTPLGASELAPGDNLRGVNGEPGKSGAAPGDLKPKGEPANTFAPGFKNPNKKR